jgi:hypothetical protein
VSVSRKVQDGKLNIRISKQLLESFDKACGERPKSVVLRMLIQNFIDGIKEDVTTNNV